MSDFTDFLAYIANEEAHEEHENENENENEDEDNDSSDW